MPTRPAERSSTASWPTSPAATRKLQSPVRSTLPGRPAHGGPPVPDGPLSVHRSSRLGPGKPKKSGTARPGAKGRRGTQDLLHQHVLRILGPGGLADPHDARRKSRCADLRGDARLPPRRPAAFFSPVSAAKDGRPPPIGPVRHQPKPFGMDTSGLLVAMHDWTRGAGEPPNNRVPRVDDKTLVPFETVRSAFPRIPGVGFPRDVHQALRLDFGPEWPRGIIANHPPKVGPAFVSLVPAVDSDGNDRGGIRIPQLEVPVATYTPWNLRDPAIGAPTERQSFLGAYFPFARTRAERRRTRDPRLSLEERYPTFEDYRGRYTAAAIRLVDQGFCSRAISET